MLRISIMHHFYVTLPSVCCGYYFQVIKRAGIRTKLDKPLKLEHDKWEIGIFYISYPKGYKKLLHNSLRLDSKEIIFPVKHYKSILI